MPFYFFPAKELTLAEAFADAFLEYKPPGILAMANSAVPPALPYEIYYKKNNIVKIKEAGKGTIFENRSFFVLDYRYVRALSDPGELSFLGWINYTHW